jgi:hypothetical protein
MVVGAEFSYLVCSLFVLESVHRDHLSVAAGIFTSLMSLGSAIGAATSSTIRQHVSGQRKEIEGFKAAFWYGVGLVGVALLLSLTVRVDKRGTKEERIRKEREEFQRERAIDAQPRSQMALWHYHLVGGEFFWSVNILLGIVSWQGFWSVNCI